MRRAMGFSMVDAIAALALVDHEAVGLGDFGKPEGWLERQVGRWRSQLDSYAELDGYPGPDIPGLDEVSAWLEANRPAGWHPGIIHGATSTSPTCSCAPTRRTRSEEHTAELQ